VCTALHHPHLAQSEAVVFTIGARNAEATFNVAAILVPWYCGSLYEKGVCSKEYKIEEITDGKLYF